MVSDRVETLNVDITQRRWTLNVDITQRRWKPTSSRVVAWSVTE